jgi:hypothetical protein
MRPSSTDNKMSKSSLFFECTAVGEFWNQQASDVDEERVMVRGIIHNYTITGNPINLDRGTLLEKYAFHMVFVLYRVEPMLNYMP